MATGYPKTAMPVDIFKQLGITDYVIPFLLVFAVMYGLLMKLKIVSDRADINGILAFTIAFLFIMAGAGYWLNSVLPVLMILFILFFIGYLLFLFLGAPQESVANALKSTMFIIMVVGLLVLFTIIGLQDWLISMDRIPARMINESGDLIVENRFQGEYIGNVTEAEGKPSMIVVDGQEYQLIKGIYYKGGYQGVAYALGTPEVVGAIMVFIILLVSTIAITAPKK